jgi:Na+-translocating ferredoxin:NAD+ oxidoreductase subunit B
MNKDKGRKAREVCKMACIACKICEKNCPSDAVHVIDNLAVIDFGKCTQCGICVQKCPQKTIIDLAHSAAEAEKGCTDGGPGGPQTGTGEDKKVPLESA